jgi:hypothetical protein
VSAWTAAAGQAGGGASAMDDLPFTAASGDLTARPPG